MSLTQVFLIFLSALVFAILGTPLAKRVAVVTGVLDQPSGRKIHHTPVPLLGGAAIYAGFVLALLLFGDRFYVRELVAILLGGTLVSLFGVVDDAHGMRPLIKLGGQLLAGVVLILSSGGLTGGPQVTIFPSTALNIAVTLIWIIGITNALNLLDNMDGLSGGIAAVASAFFLLLAALNDQVLVGAMAAALLGACIGFLRYNLNPATIFMGDTGSLFLGFILAALGIKLRFPGHTPAVTWMIPVLVLGLPIFDTALVTVSRLRRGLNPLTNGGKDHLSHRLVALGMTRREAVLTCYLIAGSFGMIAVFLMRATVTEAYLILAALIVISAGAIWRMDRHFVRPG